MKKEKEGLSSHAYIRAQLLALYGYRDLLTGETIPNFKTASYHHIIKDELGGKYSIENGAMLLHPTHDFIHNVLEIQNPALFDLLTECMVLYKQCIDLNKDNLITQFQQDVQPKMKCLVSEYKERYRGKKFY